MSRQVRRPLLAPRIQWTWVVGDRWAVASLTREGFAICHADDFKARRNDFHAEVLCVLQAEKDGQVPTARSSGMSVTQSTECQLSSRLSVRFCRREIKQHKLTAMVCSELLTSEKKAP
jgi:hypothetical protein